MSRSIKATGEGHGEENIQVSQVDSRHKHLQIKYGRILKPSWLWNGEKP